MRTLTTIAALAALACPLPAIPAAAQETTIEKALEQLQREERPNYAPALRILRQVDGRGDPAPRPAAELDAFADQVAAVAADATLPGDVRREAKYALMNAASSKSGRGYEGTPYPRAVDLLARLYEAGIVRLHSIMLADSVRGMAYMRELFERSERPPLCHRGGGYPPADQPAECDSYSFRLDARPTPWCKAGGYLFGGIVAEAWERTPGGKRPGGAGYPAPYPEGLPEHVEDWHRRCR